jgi:hypothetical protein
LNSPTDVVYRSDGSFHFTDPPHGLPKGDDDPAKELKFNAVFRMAKGKLQPVIKELSRPNGIAISPDQKTLYIGNSEEKKRIWMAYDIADNGAVSNGRLFADVTAERDAGVPDGMKVDSQGNIWAWRHLNSLAVLDLRNLLILQIGRNLGVRGGYTDRSDDARGFIWVFTLISVSRKIDRGDRGMTQEITISSCSHSERSKRIPGLSRQVLNQGPNSKLMGSSN